MRWTLGLDNPNHAATLCAMAVCFGMALAMKNFSAFKRIAGLVLAMVAVWLLAMTASRGGMAALIIATAVMAAVARQGKWWLGNLLVWGELALVSFLRPTVSQRLTEGALNEGLAGRLSVWKGACQLAWEAGFRGVSGGFGNAYSLLHDTRGVNKIWEVALGDPQTLSVEHGWWAAGLWVALPFFLAATGWQVLKKGKPVRGITLAGCAVVWLVASTVSDHSHPPCPVLLLAAVIFVFLLLASLLKSDIAWRPVWFASCAGLLAGTFVIPLIGMSLDLRQNIHVRLHREKNIQWWEVSAANAKAPLVIAAPVRVSGVGAFVRRMEQTGHPVLIVQNPTVPLTAAHWMAEQAKQRSGILIGVNTYAPAAILAKKLAGAEVPLVTWGEPLDNPVLNQRHPFTSRLSPWWAYWNEDDVRTASAHAFFERHSGENSLWLTTSGVSLNSWQAGESIAGHLLQRHLFFR